MERERNCLPSMRPSVVDKSRTYSIIMNTKITLVAVFAAVLFGSVAAPGIVVADGDESPVDSMLDDDEDDSIGMVDTAQTAANTVINTVQYNIQEAVSSLSDDDATTAEELAQLTKDSINEPSADYVDWYNEQDLPADGDNEVVELTFEEEEIVGTGDIATIYVVADVQDGDVQSLEAVEEYDGEKDYQATFSGPLVNSHSDTMEAHELVEEFHSEYVEPGDDPEIDDEFVQDLISEYAGHVDTDLIQ